MTQNRVKPLVPLIVFFLILNGFFIGARGLLEKWGADYEVLIIGNVVVLVSPLISFLIARKGLAHANPHAFVRSIMGSMMIKMFVFIILAFIYIASLKKNLNKPALFTLMGLYLVYTFIEVSILTKLL